MSGQMLRGSSGEYQADERAGVARLRCRVSGRSAGGSRAAPLAGMRQMSGEVSRGSGGEYQADERAGVALLSRVSMDFEHEPMATRLARRQRSWIPDVRFS